MTAAEATLRRDRRSWRARDGSVSDARGGTDRGFTVLEVVVAVMQVGIATAVVTAVVTQLTAAGREQACSMSAAAARTGAIAFFAERGHYPTTLREMAALAPGSIELPAGGNLNDAAADGRAAGTALTTEHWILTMTAGAGAAPPTFVCTDITP